MYNLFLGRKTAIKHGLIPEMFTPYKPKEDPSILNSFATAAFRFGHSMIQGMYMTIYSTDDHSTTFMSLVKRFYT